MANHTFTETTSRGWFSRIGNSIKGIFVGFLLVIVAVPLLFWNEGRAVKTRKTLNEGNEIYVSVSADEVDSANDGNLVYLTGYATSDETLHDPLLDVSTSALKLRRKVEMFQWHESESSRTEKKLGGGEETVTTYSYSKEWSSQHENSSKFKQPAGHENPSMPFKTDTWTAQPITVGAFNLSRSLAAQVNNFTPFDPEASEELPEEIEERKVHVTSDGYFLGEDPKKAQIGDLRIKYEVAQPGEVSIISQQKGKSFVSFVAKAGGKINMLSIGSKSADEMFAEAHAGNRMLTWGLRAAGVLLMFIGFSTVFKPLSVIADVLPIAGNIVGMGTNLVAILLTLPIALTVIGVAWLRYRPLLGVPLLILAVVGFVYLARKLLAQRKQRKLEVAAS